MKTAPQAIHHSLLMNAQSADGLTAWSMEFTVLRSANGFVRRSELTAILEKKDPASGSILRKVVRSQLPFPSFPEDATSLGRAHWKVEGPSGQVEFTGTRYQGSVRATDGDLSWDFTLSDGQALDFSPLSSWVEHRTLGTQIPVQGSWRLAEMSWSSDQHPASASLHARRDAAGIAPGVRFHSQFLTEASGGRLQSADGMTARILKAGIPILPDLTRICAFDELKRTPPFSLWRAMRSWMKPDPRGWSFRTEQNGHELRGKLQIEPKLWVTLRCEDVHGAVFYRSSTRMADLEILVLSSGKPQGHFKSPGSTWLEWTSRERPASGEIR